MLFVRKSFKKDKENAVMNERTTDEFVFEIGSIHYSVREVICQTQKTVFDHISNTEKRVKNCDTQRRNFDVLSCLLYYFDI